MGSPKVITTLFIFLFFFFFFFISISATTKACSHVFCGRNGSTIRFPFHLTDQQPNSCGYPGFELSCNSANQTILKLPYSGEFSVQAIDYTTPALRLSDPNNCLLQKLLTLNLSGSPFSFLSNNYQNIKLYNCSLNYLKYEMEPISCLSGSNYSVYASTSYTYTSSFLSPRCNLVKEISIPVQFPYYYYGSWVLNEDLQLTWGEPYCRLCERRGDRCGFKSNTSREIKCFQSGKSCAGCNTIFFKLGIPITLCVTIALCIFLRSVKAYCGRGEPIVEFTTSTIAPQPTITSRLDEHTLESYPKVVLGESRRLPNPDDDTCSICMSEYKPKETIKSMPECSHCFHADCIDEWLRLSPTCPICRNSP